MRNIFGIIVALSSAGLVIIMAQMISEGLFPFKPDMDYSDPEVMTQWMSNLPDKAYMIVAISHGLAAFIAGLVSSLVAGKGRMATGMIAFCIIFITVMVYLFTYSFPIWFVVTDTVVTAVLGFAGVVVGSARYVS